MSTRVLRRTKSKAKPEQLCFALRAPVRDLDDAGEVIRLRPGGRLRIGRHASNDFVLNHPSVSRFHAILIWERGSSRPRLIDRQSQNGIYVDGRRLGNIPVLLHGGEKLGFGELTVETELLSGGLTAPALLADEEDEAEVALFSDLGEVFSAYAWDQDALQAALLDAELDRRTGTFAVESDDWWARLTFCLGRVVTAEAADCADDDVVRRLLELQQGAFSFSRSFAPTEANLQLSIQQCLSSQKEETRRLPKWEERSEEPEVELDFSAAPEPGADVPLALEPVGDDSVVLEIDPQSVWRG